jgi:hypothetical protein
MSPRTRWIEGGLLAAILALALGLRLAGIGFGLDLADPRNVLRDRVDEKGMVNAVHAALEARDLGPRDFLIRGPGGFLVFLAVDAPLVAWRARSHPGGFDGVLAELERNPSLLHLSHRLVAAVAGVLTVLLLHRLARREFGVPAGLCAAALGAVLYQNVQDSHLGGVDTLWALASLGAVGAMLVLVRAPSARAYALAGLWVGSAIAMKYFAVLLAPALALAHLRARAAARREGRAAPPLAWLALSAAAVPLAFLAFFPGLFHSFDELLATVGHAAGFSAPRTSVGAWLAKVETHVVYSFGVGLGESAFVLGLVGLALAWRRGGAARLLSELVLVLVIGLFLTRNSPPRYAEPVLVLFALTGGLALATLVTRAPRWLGPLAVALALAPSLARSVAFDGLIARRDTRLDVLDELERRAAPRNEVLAFGSAFGMPRRAGEHRAPFKSLRRLVFGAPWRWKIDGRPGPAVASARYQAVLADLPQYVLWNQAGPAHEGYEALHQILRARYRPVLALDGRRGAVVLPDPVTVDFVPYVFPWRMTRPGPPFVLYERVQGATDAPSEQ